MKSNQIGMLILIILVIYIPAITIAQIRITKNGETVIPNSTGINVNSSDLLTVIIPNSSTKSVCMKNMGLQVSLTNANKVAKIKRPKKQSQQQRQTYYSDNCTNDGYKKLGFTLTGENKWISSFTVDQYWKKKEARSYIRICFDKKCNAELFSIDREISQYTFYLLQ